MLKLTLMSSESAKYILTGHVMKAFHSEDSEYVLWRLDEIFIHDPIIEITSIADSNIAVVSEHDKMYQKLRAMPLEDLEIVWFALKTVPRGYDQFYALGIPMADWTTAVYSELSRKRSEQHDESSKQRPTTE